MLDPSSISPARRLWDPRPLNLASNNQVRSAEAPNIGLLTLATLVRPLLVSATFQLVRRRPSSQLQPHMTKCEVLIVHYERPIMLRVAKERRERGTAAIIPPEISLGGIPSPDHCRPAAAGGGYHLTPILVGPLIPQRHVWILYHQQCTAFLARLAPLSMNGCVGMISACASGCVGMTAKLMRCAAAKQVLFEGTGVCPG